MEPVEVCFCADKSITSAEKSKFRSLGLLDKGLVRTRWPLCVWEQVCKKDLWEFYDFLLATRDNVVYNQCMNIKSGS